jgi:hypothetical protein
VFVLFSKEKNNKIGNKNAGLQFGLHIGGG